MGKLLSLLLSTLVGGGLAGAAALGIISSSTHAPAHNPASVSTSIIGYGNH